MTSCSELDQYFTYKCEVGLQTRGLLNKIEYRDRLRFEMETIVQMGFPGYFLIVQDFIEWAKRNGIYVGPGRGSVAGSLVSYCLRITELDPLHFGLLFERFLNPDRISMPDCDVDFEKRYRDRVINYVTEKYGEDRVAHIGTFNMQRAKAAVRSIAKTLGHPYAVGDQLAKLLLAPIHGKPQTLSTSIKKIPELHAYRNSESTQGDILRWAEKVEDHISNVGVHASGVIISNSSMLDTVPLFKGRSGEITTQWEMNNIEEVGLIKFDFLGLDALEKMHKCIDLVEKRHGKKIDINKIDLEDKKVFAKLRTGDNVGVFQLEASSGMKDLLVLIRPTEIEDLIALVAIYRPGPLCLSGDTPILTNIYPGKYKTEYRYEVLESLYKTYQSKLILKRRPRSIKSLDEKQFLFRNNRIKRIHKSGTKKVYKVNIQAQLTNDYSPSKKKPQRRTDQIQTTLDHKFLTSKGWKALYQLKPGDYLAINYRGHFGVKRSKNIYGKKNFRNIAFRHYEYRCIFCNWNSGPLDVNHIEGNRHTNNMAENLCFLCPNHHREYTEGHISKDKLISKREECRLPITSDIMFVRYLGKEDIGEKQTYDIEMEDPYNNFVAADFIVHNSSDYKDIYLDVRAGKRDPEYLVPELEPILKKTSGWCIYQEQAMEIAKQLCSYTGGEADELRKAIGKKKQKLMDKHENKFINGWVKNDLDKDKGKQLWNDIKAFASYSFNKSHAAAYAYITYQTAWLKTHYPCEYMCAVMECDASNKDQMIRYLSECKRLRIKVLPPDINKSRQSFHVDKDGNIRFGLGPIKNLGEGPVEKVIEEREKRTFKSLRDFCERVDLGTINKLKLESLIKAGAFDGMGMSRATMVAAVETVWEYRAETKRYLKKLDTYQRKLDAVAQRIEDIEKGVLSDKGKKLKPLRPLVRPEEPEWPELLELDELPREQLLAEEHELLGFFVSAHPLGEIDTKLFGHRYNSINDIKRMPSKTKINLAAVVTSKTEITTSKSKKKMAFITFEDLTGSIEGVCFPNVYKANERMMGESKPISIAGIVEVTEADDGRVTKIIVRRMEALDLTAKERPERIVAEVKASRANQLISLLEKYKGDLHEVQTVFKTSGGSILRSPTINKIGNFKGAFMRKLMRINDDK